MATNENSELSEIKNMMKLQREVSRGQNWLVIHPLPHVIFAIKKDIWQKTVLRQKHILNVTLKDT